MVVVNLQERVIAAPPEVVGRLLDRVLDEESIWPSPPWSPLELDRGLAVGSRGGHGSIRYEVIGYRPGEWVRFRFDPRLGFDGYHELSVRASAQGTELRHLAVADPRGRMRWLWPLAVRWLHEAVLQDLLDNAERAATGAVRMPNRWSPWVRALRRVLAHREPSWSPSAGATPAPARAEGPARDQATASSHSRT